jgi:L-alanine-DL-glutamate epimerase-like enolase superfamily enzyme
MLVREMELDWSREELKLIHTWTIARGSATRDHVVVTRLVDADGVVGWGEAAPAGRYGEKLELIESFLRQVDPRRLSFDDLAGSMAYLEGLADGNASAKGALNIALLDGAARKAGKPIHDFLGIGFCEGAHQTSFSIGIDSEEMMRKKTAEAEDYPILKIKVGVPGDRENLAAVRAMSPTKRVRVDANEGWKTKEEALAMIEWLATDRNVEFCEQPMPANTPARDLAWLKERSPLPLMADESFVSARDVPHCQEFFHSVNVKLVKTGGVTAAFEALRAARDAGLKTMLGCMIETSILISAAAHLAGLADYLDLDGNLLISNDPFAGASAAKGMISFRDAPEAAGLRVTRRREGPDD